MEDYFDEICLLLLCCLSLMTCAANPLAITGLLGAISLVCFSSSKKPALRLATQGIYLITACANTAFLTFLPVAAYTLMHERSWAVRLSWLIPFVLAALTNTFDFVELIFVGTLSVMASAMAIRDVRFSSERTGMIDTCDELRERNRTLAQEHPPTSSDESSHSDDERQFHSPIFDDLTKREAAIVQLVAEGLDNREIANRLFLSEGTVRNHISTILSKKKLRNRTQIAIMYYRGQ